MTKRNEREAVAMELQRKGAQAGLAGTRQPLVSKGRYRMGACMAAAAARAQEAEPKIGSMRPSAKGKRGRA